MTERESILTRIKKLQNLTTERGATPEEAAVAAAKIQAILFEHNIAMAEVETHPDQAGCRPDPYGKVEHEHQGATRTNMGWKRTLLHYVAKYNFCSTVYHPGTTKQSVIGKRSNVEVVLYLNAHLATEIDRLAREAARSILSGKAAYINSFCLGATNTIIRRLREQRDHDEQRATPPGQTTTALVLRRADAELTTAIAKFYPRLRKGAASGRIGNPDGYHAGRQAGESISLNRGIGRAAKRGLLS